MILLIGCNISDLDFDNLRVENLSSDLAVPFGTASYTFEELLQDIEESENFDVDAETQEIRFLYRDTIDYAFSIDLFDVPDTDEGSTLDIPNFANNSGGDFAYPPFTFEFDQPYVSAEEETIDSVFHSNDSEVQITIDSSSPFDLDYTLSLLDTRTTSDDTPIIFNGTLNSSASSVHNQNLNGYKTILETSGDENLYDMTLDISGTMADGEEFLNDQLTVTVEFINQSFEIAFGKFGQDTVEFNTATLDIAFFEDLGADGIEFGGATMTFDVISTFGIPLGLGLDGMYAEEDDGTRSYLTGSAVNDPLVITSASLDESTYEAIASQSTLEINNSNSNIGTFLGTSPSTIGFDLTGITNPDDATASNFLREDAELEAAIEVEIPLEVKMIDVQQTLDFEVDGGVDFTEVDSLELRLVTVNELPLNATLDLLIMTAAEDTLYIVEDRIAIDQPFLNFDRTVREPKIAVEDIPLGSAGTEAMSNADIIRVVLTLNTPSSQTSEEIFVKLLANQGIDVSLGARGILDVEL